MSRLRASLRIARRTVLRSPARSLLIAILVCVPVAGATYADVIARTFDSPEREAWKLIGAADASIQVTAHERVRYDLRSLFAQSSGTGPERDPASVDLSALLPVGSRSVRMPGVAALALQRGDGGIARTQLLVGDVREPLHRHILRLEEGRAPAASEALVTRPLAKRMKLLDDGEHLLPGAQITVVGGDSTRVSGLARNPTCLSCEQVVVTARSPIARAATDLSPYPYGASAPTYLVDLPPGASEPALGRTLAAHGVSLTTHEALAHPERHPAPEGVRVVGGDTVRAIALVAVIVALGLLEVVLLAGTAFAVGARRQVRELGLVAASGGSRADIRRIVLAQGLVLGALGAALGVGAGVAIARGGQPLWERLADSEIVGWSFGPWEIAAVALVGLLSGLAAAVVPAMGAARMLPVNALAGRFRTADRARRRGTLAGAVLAAIGAACGVAGGRMLSADIATDERVIAQAARSGRYLAEPVLHDGPLVLVIGGATLAIVGAVLLAPALIGWIAKAGTRLPLTARLAVRDAERHRHRTGPATGAIVIVVTGSVALAFLLAGRFRADELRHVPAVPAHMLAVMRGADSTATTLRAARSAAAELPGARVRSLALALGPRPTRSDGVAPEEARALAVDQRPRDDCPQAACGFVGGDGSVAIGRDDALTRQIAGAGFDAAALRALRDGKMIVFDRLLLDRSGDVVINSDGDEKHLPGHLVERARAYGLFPSALVSERAARAHGWDVGQRFVFVSYADRATRDDVDSAVTAAEHAGAFAVYDSGPGNAENLAMALIAGAAAFVTLVGVAISVALSAAEGRADLATLAAVGAPPRRRRALMAGQALLVGGLGCLLGVGLGTFVAITARATTGSPELVVPWANLAVTAFGVPLLAALVAALCTRSRMPMVRRLE